MIARNSRYAAAKIAEVTAPDGTVRRHVVPPLLPPAAAYRDRLLHVVTDSDRLDLLATRHLGAPGVWVTIAAAAPVAHHGQVLDTPGARIAVPMPGSLPDPLMGPDGEEAGG